MCVCVYTVYLPTQPAVRCRCLMHGYCIDTLKQSSMHAQLSARGCREETKARDAGFKVKTVIQQGKWRKTSKNVTFANSRHVGRFFADSLNGLGTSFGVVCCQHLESQAGQKTFCSIKRYCNGTPDRKRQPQGCDRRWSSMSK